MPSTKIRNEAKQQWRGKGGGGRRDRHRTTVPSTTPGEPGIFLKSKESSEQASDKGRRRKRLVLSVVEEQLKKNEGD